MLASIIEEGVKEHGLCAAYARRFRQCRTKRQFADVAFRADSIAYAADAIAEGWMDADTLEKELSAFVNGSYVRDIDGYTSSVHFGRDAVEATETVMLLVGCEKATVPDGRVCELHVACSPSFSVDGEGTAYVTVHEKGSTKKFTLNAKRGTD